MGGDCVCGGPGGKTWLAPRGLLRLRLVVVAVCLAASAAGIVGSVTVLMARGYLVGAADRQLSAYAALLSRHPFPAMPASPLLPGPGGTGRGGFSLEVLSSAGQPVMSAGRETPPVRPVSVRVGAGRPATVSAEKDGQSWLVVAEPVSYRAQRIPFTYGDDGFSLVISGPGRPGLHGTLIVGLDLRSVNHVLGRLVLTCLAAGGALVLAVACLSLAGLRALVRPLAVIEQTAAAVQAGEFSRRVPDRQAPGEVARLTRSLNAMLAHIERGLSARAASEATARTAAERLSGVIIDTGHKLQRPLSLLGGFAEYHRAAGPRSAAELDHAIRRVAAEAARLDVLLDDLTLTCHDHARRDEPAAPQHQHDQPAPEPNEDET